VHQKECTEQARCAYYPRMPFRSAAPASGLKCSECSASAAMHAEGRADPGWAGQPGRPAADCGGRRHSSSGLQAGLRGGPVKVSQFW